jgi:hypothetical protein
MKRVIGRRALFFFVMAVICFVLVPPSPAEFRWVAWFSAGLALIWAILLSVEDLARPRLVRPPGDPFREDEGSPAEEPRVRDSPASTA